MNISEFNEKLLEEVDKLDGSETNNRIIKQILKYEMNSHGRYDFDDYDRIFERELDKK
ncbi:hypothetical protein HOD20_03040 [archaeon]|jgi:hypothetical protein|nr:hypothetical protein [archaeon]MBT4648395.1 hypothetical protein [archaeon]MBT4858667.1 hypothetical protein [archaeon]